MKQIFKLPDSKKPIQQGSTERKDKLQTLHDFVL